MSPRLLVTLLGLSVLWGSAFPLIKVGLEGFSATNLTLLRFLVASASFVPYLLITRRRLMPARADMPSFLLLGLLGITIYHLALNYGSLHVSAGAASLIIATAPAITAVVALFWLGERLPPLGWLGIIAAFVGVAIIAVGEDPQPGFNPYALLVLLSSVVTAFFVVLQKRMLAKYGAVEITAFATWSGTAPLLVFLPSLPADLATAGTVHLGCYLHRPVPCRSGLCALCPRPLASAGHTGHGLSLRRAGIQPTLCLAAARRGARLAHASGRYIGHRRHRDGQSGPAATPYSQQPS